MKCLAFFLHEPKIPKEVINITLFQTSEWFDQFFAIKIHKFNPKIAILFDDGNYEFKKFIITEKIKGEIITVINDHEEEFSAFMDFVKIIEDSKRSEIFKTMKANQERLDKNNAEYEALTKKMNNLNKKRSNLIEAAAKFEVQYYNSVYPKLLKIMQSKM
jgi:hypothetical protein